ncbi:MAG: aldose epimerase [Myxococcales bacterium]|nr:aldose epimerase [Myxococcota bacterium]MDW8282932.1 aldose epimerase [Myxococcales bacterium]
MSWKDPPTRREPSARRSVGPGGLEVWELAAGLASARVIPSRGGLVTRFAVGHDEVLYLDPETLPERSKSVRGGIGVLFPIAGRLTGDRYTVDSTTYPMRPHGLARQAPWGIREVSGARITMELCSSEATRVNYPFEFTYRLTVDLGRAGGRSLALEQEIDNTGRRPLPLHLGFQPYLAVPEERKHQARVETAARTCYDNLRGEIVPYAPPDFGAGEVDLHLLDHRSMGTRLHVPGRPARILQWSAQYTVLVLWTQRYKGFICVEPWTAPADAFNSGQGLVLLPPGERFAGHLIITVE